MNFNFPLPPLETARADIISQAVRTISNRLKDAIRDDDSPPYRIQIPIMAARYAAFREEIVELIRKHAPRWHVYGDENVVIFSAADRVFNADDDLKPEYSAPIQHIYLDMDGVLSDFCKAACAAHHREHYAVLNGWPDGEYDVAKVFGISSRELWRVIDRLGVDFWTRMRKTTECDQIIAWARGNGIPWSICTMPSLSPACAAGKVLWMQELLGTCFRRFVITPQKYLLAKPGALLIDDCTENIRAFRNHGGKGVIFPRPWSDMSDFDAPTALEARLKPFEHVVGEVSAIINQ